MTWWELIIVVPMALCLTGLVLGVSVTVLHELWGADWLYGLRRQLHDRGWIRDPEIAVYRLGVECEQLQDELTALYRRLGGWATSLENRRSHLNEHSGRLGDPERPYSEMLDWLRPVVEKNRERELQHGKSASGE